MGYKSRAITRLHESIERRFDIIFGTFRSTNRNMLVTFRIGDGSDMVEFEAGILGRAIYFGRALH
jgi:hypothetical protein